MKKLDIYTVLFLLIGCLGFFNMASREKLGPATSTFDLVTMVIGFGGAILLFLLVLLPTDFKIKDPDWMTKTKWERLASVILLKVLFSICIILSIIFINLKYFGKIQWEWAWVTSPLWIWGIIITIYFSIIFDKPATIYIKRELPTKVNRAILNIGFVLCIILSFLKQFELLEVSWKIVIAPIVIAYVLMILYSIIRTVIKIIDKIEKLSNRVRDSCRK